MSEQTKLRLLLFGFWLLLLVPTLFLGYQTYQRLQFESLHQYRTLAETLTDGIASSLGLAMQQEAARDPAEYGFTVGGNRSPLSLLKPTSGLPGILGFFQVDAQGELSSPVMPIGVDLSGIPVEELALRQLKLQSIENALLLDIPEPTAPSATTRPNNDELAEADSIMGSIMGSAIMGSETLNDSRVVPQSQSALRAQRPEALEADISLDALTPKSTSPARQSANLQRNQILYEELAQADKPSTQRRDRQKTSAARELELETGFFSRASQEQTKQMVQEKLGKAKVSKVKRAELREVEDITKLSTPASTPVSPRLATQSIGSDSNAGPSAANSVANSAGIRSDSSAAFRPGPSRPNDAKVEVSLFGSTVTDFALRPLSANHLLLFRRVWQSAQPLVQGLVLDRQQFFAGAVTNAYSGSALAEVSDLAVAVDGQVQLTLAAGSAGYSAGARLSGGELLYRRYLGSPFGNVELLFSARELPLAAGASLVLWTLLVLVSLLCAGFVLLYILGKRQLQQRQQQQDFVSAVSHELKTPLTSIRMYGEMLKSGWVDEAKKPEYYDYIFNESERLSRLISNVLQLSSITRGRSDLQLGPLSVTQILDLVRSRSAAQVKAHNYQLNINCDPGLRSTELVVDEDALLQVMINLIDNALKFSNGCERKELLLSVVRDANEVVFSLRDYGPGIERGQLDKIFELFYRSENELTRETVGTGIGLALVQELVGAMGGRITARNCEPGAEFVVRLPG